MRIGVIARATDRGLGIQTWEAARALDATVLVVNIDNPSSKHYPTDLARFPDAPVVTCTEGWRLPEDTVRGWLAGLDVVWTAETFYDARFCDWARDAGVRTYIHANPEFVPAGGRGWGIGQPTAWWTATCWRQDHMPDGTKVVPFPVATDRFRPAEPHDGPCRWLHVAGKQALGDRNGTEAVIAALPLLEQPCSVRIITQDPELPARITAPAHVDLELVTGGLADYWDLYTDVDALILPRRYGGLCLPVQEAMAAGLAVVMPDIDPNNQTWPTRLIPAGPGVELRMPAGKIPVASIDPADVAAGMDALADPHERLRWQRWSRSWATANSWRTRAGRWRRLFADT